MRALSAPVPTQLVCAPSLLLWRSDEATRFILQRERDTAEEKKVFTRYLSERGR